MPKYKQVSLFKSSNNKLSFKSKISKGKHILHKYLKEANDNGHKYLDQLDNKIIKHIKQLLQSNSKSICTALFSLTTYKLVDPNQDIRLAQLHFHNKILNNKGFDARYFDEKCTTPFIRNNHFSYANSDNTAWLTRTLTYPYPYTLQYPNHMRPKYSGNLFLHLITYIQHKNCAKFTKVFLISLIYLSIKNRELNNIKPKIIKGHRCLRINDIIHLLKKYFNYKNYPKKDGGNTGNFILPVIAIYSIYKILVNENDRYRDKKLLPLASQFSSDVNSGLTGDIIIANQNDNPKEHNKDRSIYEAIEIKYNKPENVHMLNNIYSKLAILDHPESRYYLLSTKPYCANHNKNINERRKIRAVENEIYKRLGTEVIADGVFNTLKRYLRLIKNVKEFINVFTINIDRNNDLNISHKRYWNKIIRKYISKHRSGGNNRD